MSTTGTRRMYFSGFEQLDTPENHSGSIGNILDRSFTFTDGVGANQADIVWSDRRTIAAGATSTIDMGTGGGLVDVFGNSIVPIVEVVAIMVYNRSATAGDILTVGPHAAANPFLGPWSAATSRNRVGPETPWGFWYNTGWAVTDGAADTWSIIETGGANPVDVDIIIIARSA